MGKSFITYTEFEIDFIKSCQSEVLKCGLYKRFTKTDVDIKPTVNKLISSGFIYEKNNVYLITAKGKQFLKDSIC